MTGHRILIIEDDLDFAGQLKTLMESLGYSAVVALTGGDGLRLFREWPADLALVDVKLPHVHGLRVASDIRSIEGGADVPIFLMSAVYRRPELFEGEMVRLGIDTYLSKPFSFEDLGRRVADTLSQDLGGRASVRGIVDGVMSGDQSVTYGRSDSSPAPLAAAFSGDSARDGLSDEDTMLRVDSARRLPRNGRLTPEICVRILTTIFHSHSCGRLVRLVGDKRRTVFLLNGYPVWAAGPTPGEGVLRFLRVEGILDGPSAKEIEEKLRGGGESLRSLLVGTGRLDGDEVDGLLEDWVADEVCNALRHKGPFEFTRDESFAGKIPVYEINPIATLWEGLKSAIDPSELRRSMAELSDRSIGRTRSFGKLFGYVGASNILKSVGDFIEQPRAVRQIRAEFPEESSLNLSLWFLLHAGLVAVSDSPDPREAAARRRASSESSVARRGGEKPVPPSKPVSSAVPESVADPGGMEIAFEVRTTSSARTRARQLKAELEAESPDPLELVARHHARRLDMDHYSFLGVEQDASLEEIDAVYQELAPRYRLRNLGFEVPEDSRAKARSLLAKLVNAFAELSDPARRRAYDSILSRDVQNVGRDVQEIPAGSAEAGSAADLGEETDRSVTDTASARVAPSEPQSLEHTDWIPGADEADDIHRRCGRLDEVDAANLREALQAMKAGAFNTAFNLLDSLRERYPADVQLLADMAWCRFGSDPEDDRCVDKALEWVDLGLAFEPSSCRALAVKTRILCHTGREVEAHAALRRVAPLLPESEWVRSELERRNESADELVRAKGLRRFWGGQRK